MIIMFTPKNIIKTNTQRYSTDNYEIVLPVIDKYYKDAGERQKNLNGDS